jgi:hypothetical protein
MRNPTQANALTMSRLKIANFSMLTVGWPTVRRRLADPLSGNVKLIGKSGAGRIKYVQFGKDLILLKKIRFRRPEDDVNALISYLINHLMLDFEGDLTMEQVKEFLRGDDSRDGRALLAKLVEDRGTSDMMITLADCLKEYLRSGINEEVVRDQLRTYTES